MKEVEPSGQTQVDPTKNLSSPVPTLPLSEASVPVEARGAATTTEDAARPQKIDRYLLQRLLGSGGFGQVFLARDAELNRLVAVKVPHRHLLAQPHHAELYLAEARHLASLDHPNIVPVFDVGCGEDGLPFVVSKFIEGRDLAAHRKTARLAFDESAQLVATVAEALHHAHRRGLVHRDIKPANILLDAEGKPYVVDFGLALKEEDFGRTKGLAGTPSYMSPEQARGEGHRVDGRSDVFSLGVVLYELLTGKRPFNGKTAEEVLKQVTSDEARPPRQVDDSIPRELERICLKALSKRATERYTTALDFADDLRQFLLHSPDAHRPSAAPGQLAEQATLATIPTMTARTLNLERQALRIIPKGLRSFDEHDTDFFLELLPGPRDREGLPDSIRFWKTRIEETDADKTFSVGLLYGPSGCGKSSLVKAGLLPRLPDNVIPIYVEATAEETEARLLNGLRKRCPGVLVGLSLKETLTTLRRGQGLPPGKVLIILDQFEQWLHARRDEPNTALVQALRQCDGAHVQCIVMVRDDFWMAATRFMRELEIHLVEGQNSAAVDLFDIRHAKKVLATFGRAFGRLPEAASETTKDQQTFLTDAVAGLADNGKVISVRLALLAEMMKGRPWSAATWKEVGGTAGVGVTFLEETFSSATAPPQHRLHQKAARAVLKALLPEAGADIKGNMRSYADLLQASGYAGRPQHFADLIHILDSEIRLITPTDPEGATGDQESSAKAESGQKYYQLTHDYLVPSLRDWLTRKQKETRRGRAELRLAELAAAWNAKPEARHLPNWWEWAGMTLLTPHHRWTEPQRKMMRKATQRHGLHASAMGLVLVGLFAAGMLVRRQIVEQSNARYAEALVQRLLDAQTTQVPAIIAELERYRSWADPLLNRRFQEAPPNSRQQLHAGLALLPIDSKQLDFLCVRLLESDPLDFPILATALAPHKDALGKWLWTEARQSGKGYETRSLRAAAALAAYDPASLSWPALSIPVAQQLVAQNPVFLAVWMDAFRPVRNQLLPSLAVIFRDRRPENAAQRSLAANILAEFAADQPAFLANLIMDADDQQFAVLLPSLQKQAEQAAKTLSAELAIQLKPRWQDAPLDPAWSPLSAESQRKIEAAQGLVAERFAFCQTLPLPDALQVIEDLRPSGYRPLHFRPYTSGQVTQVTAVWTRDGLEFKLDHDLPAAKVPERAAENRQRGFQAADLAGYRAKDEVRYAVLWVKGDPHTLTELQVGLDERQLEARDSGLGSQAYWRTVTTSLANPSGGQLYAAIWSKPPARPLPGPSDSLSNSYLGGEANYSGENYLADLQVDVHLARAAPPFTTKVRYTQQLAEGERALAARSGDAAARYLRGTARFYLGQSAGALEDFSWLIEQSSPPAADHYRYRAIAHARLGNEKEARQDLARFQELSTVAGRSAAVEAIVATYLGDDTAALKRLDAAAAANANRPSALFDASCAYAVAGGHLQEKDGTRAAHYMERALNLLQAAIAKGFRNYAQLQTNPNLDPLRELPRFAALLEPGSLDRHFAAVWNPVAGISSAEIHGLDPVQQLVRSKALIAEGYRPVSFAAAEIQTERPPVTASVWQRPEVPDSEREALALRQARAAVGLVKLNHPGEVRPLLQQQPDPRVRSYLIHQLSRLHVDFKDTLGLSTDDVSTRRAVLMALGGLPESDFGPAERESLISDLVGRYRDEPDAGIHGALAWLLHRWGQAEQLQKIDKELATGQVEDQRQWFLNRQGQTLTVIPGPIDFLMGSPRFDKEREGGAGNHLETLHRQRIDRTFAIAAREVTVEQFLRFRKEHDYPRQQAAATDCPVTAVTWFDAAAYCNWLSQQEKIPSDQCCYLPNATGKYADGMKLNPDYLSVTGYRLPTEAEWECACRAGAVTSRPYGQSDTLLKHYAWHMENSQDRGFLPVGSLLPNDFGLFDMLGNAVEWTQDAPLYYLAGQGGQPSDDAEQLGPLTSGDFRVLRGGSFNIQAVFVRAPYRFRNLPNQRWFVNGFRVARTMPSVP